MTTTRYQVYYDSNDGNHRWFNCTKVRFGLRWIHAVGVEGDFIRVPRRRVLAITRKDGK